MTPLTLHLTHSLRAEYYYSAASHASSPAGVLLLRDFQKLVKKKSIGAIGFRFVPLDSPMFVVSVPVFSFLQDLLVRSLGSRGRTIAQQTVLTLHSMHDVVFIAADPACRRTE